MRALLKGARHGFDYSIIRGAQNVERNNPGTFQPETLKQMEAYLKQISENTGNTDKKVGSKINLRPE